MTKDLESSKRYPIQPTLAVGGVVFKDQKVLLVKRGKAPAKGVWAIPGESVNLGETIKKAAEREIFEETGIRIEATKPVYSFESIDHDENGKVRFHYYVVDLETEYLSEEIIPGDDADDAAWVTAEELTKKNVNPRTLALLSNQFNFG